jgi:hypothetical protein
LYLVGKDVAMKARRKDVAMKARYPALLAWSLGGITVAMFATYLVLASSRPDRLPPGLGPFDYRDVLSSVPWAVFASVGALIAARDAGGRGPVSPCETAHPGPHRPALYRSKYDAVQTLADFSAKLRDEIDLDHLTTEWRPSSAIPCSRRIFHYGSGPRAMRTLSLLILFGSRSSFEGLCSRHS